MPTEESKTNPVDTAFNEYRLLKEVTEFTPVLRSLLLSLMIEEYMQFMMLISDSNSLAELEKVGKTATKSKTVSGLSISPQVYAKFDKGATGIQISKVQPPASKKNYYIINSVTVIEETPNDDKN